MLSSCSPQSQKEGLQGPEIPALLWWVEWGPAARGPALGAQAQEGPTEQLFFHLLYKYDLGSKIIAVGDCNNEIKRCLLLGRKSMTILAY